MNPKVKKIQDNMDDLWAQMQDLKARKDVLIKQENALFQEWHNLRVAREDILEMTRDIKLMPKGRVP